MWNIVGYCMWIIGGILIIVSLVMMIVWKVPTIIDELSGRKAKRQIARMKKLGTNISSKPSNSGDISNIDFNKGFQETVSNSSRDLHYLVDNPIMVSTEYKGSAYKEVNDVKSDTKEYDESNTSFMSEEDDIFKDSNTEDATSFMSTNEVVFDNNDSTSYLSSNSVIKNVNIEVLLDDYSIDLKTEGIL